MRSLGTDLLLAGCWTVFVLLSASGPALAGGPIPGSIVPSGIAAELVDVAQLPASSAIGPRARTNLLSAAPDESGRLFVNDMRGFLWILRDGAIDPTPMLDLASLLGSDLDTAGLQTGLSTFAFHPAYATPGAAGEGKLYTVTSEALGTGVPDFVSPLATMTHLSVLSEWSVDPNDADRIDTSSRRVLMRIRQPSRDHNMGQIAFDPNAAPDDSDYGLLYIAIGDGGGYNANLGGEIDPSRSPQNTGNIFGSILRIDPLGSSSKASPTNGEYGIPADNPFAGNTQGVLQEIWAFGFRNPHRFSWDREGAGAMLISDIGQVSAEEINVGAAGGNYGWSEREGTFTVNHLDQNDPGPLPKDDASFGYRYPAAQYDHDEGRAVVGAFVYRGAKVPELFGQYVFGDVANGRIFHVPVDELLAVDPFSGTGQAVISELTLLVDGVETTLLEAVGSQRADLRFGLDNEGELYVLTKTDGMVRTLMPLPLATPLESAALAAIFGVSLARRVWRSRLPVR